ncbi:tRNA delta(2)-isopentenylpyrophosphate transferase [Ligilactobacillus hayakitensis DSM 18933 = JCM 14209]|uniref:tRNA dimethylallyltransferase n=1 Tax=Ligilactobacillus hayakitensis DSM 18933 = JCM 14209 TaxID=1423755 RepID=A0A0R1WM14_9LACO|nr:tRNA (adenosine(37)-N6)-dimethylallyltransferase MiaA [Ligilactobacillus hayakitensis]KRM18799.1 tRNA delta(2)-isopentenylpyrophosphate transferase [Ligilactobacillus hayakitensis DSM 18933 = JCM 14209]
MTRKIILIVGPTAVGKTKLSIELAQKFDGEIISGDSMQVYRNLDIGTAKVTTGEMKGIPHHLIDIRDIDEQYTAADFIAEAKSKIEEISNRGKMPVIAGGTGFYLQVLLDNFKLGSDDNTIENKDDIRNELQGYLEKNGSKKLWERLEKIDPVAASKIPIGNSRRVIRALEVYYRTGKLFSEQNDQKTSEFDPLIIGLTTDRALLYERINQRVDIMIENGLLDEAKYLFEKGNMELSAAKGIGYKEFYEYFEGKISLDDAIALVKRNSRRYAKRQLTWFRNKMDVNWFDIIQNPEEIQIINAKVKKWREK